MGHQYLRLTYPPRLINEPIIYRLGHEFGLMTNIRRANVSRDQGWVVLELRGDDDDLRRAIAWAQETGIVVEPVEETDAR
jgi:L-aspartate semialdehyde sulfurtransferase ferredoxin